RSRRRRWTRFHRGAEKRRRAQRITRHARQQSCGRPTARGRAWSARGFRQGGAGKRRHTDSIAHGARLNMIHIALWEPEIPPNTGNIARLCAATGSPLHLIGRLGFRLDDRSLRRAGLDYWDLVKIHRHDSWSEFESAWLRAGKVLDRIFCLSARAAKPYTAVSYKDGDCLLFGAETRGLPQEMIERFGERALTIPMPGEKARSLNLATAAGIVLYEALRQQHIW